MRIALAQINTIVGDFEGNFAKISARAEEAARLGADIVAFPELTITGYPPEDLVLKPRFVTDNKLYLQRVVKLSDEMPSLVMVVGFIDGADEIYNAAAVIQGGKLHGVYHKVSLPNYGVFDEKRYFEVGNADGTLVFQLNDLVPGDEGRSPACKVGVSICEDIWVDDGPPVAAALVGGAELIININASPFHVGKWRQRLDMLARRAVQTRAYVAYVNLIGGQDELVFDGHSMVLAPDGGLVASAGRFVEDLLVVDLDVEQPRHLRAGDDEWREAADSLSRRVSLRPAHEIKIGVGSETGQTGQNRRTRPKALDARQTNAEVRERTGRYVTEPKRRITQQTGLSAALPEMSDEEEVFQALLTGTGDYVRKNGFSKVLVGLSGGIDSAIVATIAADALGAANVECVFMPSRYTSGQSERDAKQMAANLGTGFRVIPIEPIFTAFLTQLAPAFGQTPAGVAEENLQARIRGTLLMALSNKFGWLLLSTGNKSEMSVGYATLYGDMSGGFAVLKDVPKTLVYQLASLRNEQAGRWLIPESIIVRPPTAELRANQKDIDALPPYEVLDPIIKCYVERDLSVSEICDVTSVDRETVRKVLKMIDASEYKRRQAPPGVKITLRAFGKDWRFPITNKFLS